jgi:hypothetical protein
MALTAGHTHYLLLNYTIGILQCSAQTLVDGDWAQDERKKGTMAQKSPRLGLNLL